MKAKLHLGKTATSRSRKKKPVEEVSKQSDVHQPDDFINYLLGKGYSSSTAASFYSDVRKFKAWLEKEGMEIENVNYNDVTSYLQSFGNIAQHTKGCYLRGVKQYFNFLIQRGERTDNPAAFIQLKGLKKKNAL
ncbi:MAG: site-specific integrase [Chitinophagaceae bacterium]|nr:site-specific integrase [Chitinophagaceae bacterium]